MLPNTKSSDQEDVQRVQVSMERSAAGQHVRIEVENHDSVLGWYTASSVVLPMRHLPLLEQAMEEMRRRPADEEYGKIIPFPFACSAA